MGRSEVQEMSLDGIQFRISAAFPNGEGSLRARPDLLLVGPVNYAEMTAFLKFQGRDRRRVKREMNKAVRLARRGLRK